MCRECSGSGILVEWIRASGSKVGGGPCVGHHHAGASVHWAGTFGSTFCGVETNQKKEKTKSYWDSQVLCNFS
jgi:hypothetical protein